MRKKVSIVMATYNRAHLLARSLHCYAMHSFDNTDMELVVIDDHSTDHTRDMVLEWSKFTGVAVTYLIPSPKGESWRDCGAILNHGIRASQGDYIILTHPEVMPGIKSVANCVSMMEDYEKSGNVRGVYACCRIYYLSPQDQTRLDSVDWMSEGILAVRSIEGFYEDDTNGHPDFRHEVTDKIGSPGYRIKTWNSWVFGGMSRRVWKNWGGMIETSKWGSVDIAFMHRRAALGVPNYTCYDPLTICCHQNHDLPGDVETPRIESVWREELKDMPINDHIKMSYPNVDNLGWI